MNHPPPPPPPDTAEPGSSEVGGRTTNSTIRSACQQGENIQLFSETVQRRTASGGQLISCVLLLYGLWNIMLIGCSTAWKLLVLIGCFCNAVCSLAAPQFVDCVLIICSKFRAGWKLALWWSAAQQFVKLCADWLLHSWKLGADRLLNGLWSWLIGCSTAGSGVLIGCSTVCEAVCWLAVQRFVKPCADWLLQSWKLGADWLFKGLWSCVLIGCSTAGRWVLIGYSTICEAVCWLAAPQLEAVCWLAAPQLKAVCWLAAPQLEAGCWLAAQRSVKLNTIGCSTTRDDVQSRVQLSQPGEWERFLHKYLE